MRHALLLLALLSAPLGCAHHAGDNEPSPEVAQGIIRSALAGVEEAAPAWRAFLAQESPEACAVFAAAALVAPMLRSGLDQAWTGEGLVAFPQVVGDAQVCGLSPVAQVDPLEVARYSDLAWSSVRGVLVAFGPAMRGLSCDAYVVTLAALDYTRALVPALVASLATWTIEVPSYPIDYTSCAAG